MRHISAILIKFVMVTIVLGITLSVMTNLTFTDILYVSATVTILAYVVGDLLILSITNNVVATIADAALALATIYAFNFIWEFKNISFTDSLITALILGVGEWFFHKYVAKNVLMKSTDDVE
ncbi:MAG: hypothetical protein K0S41_3858 [Anaerocolumna sp.]|jgi:hypothetical protein|nr:hypothetical protein [Anaerocolumna sp.]